MQEANLLLVHRSEDTRQLLKWALLCAVTRDCIEPEGASLWCRDKGKDGQCHRQDQSALNILLVNLEQRLIYEGKKLLTHVDKRHPKNSKQRHQTKRGQFTNANIARFNCTS